MTKTTKSTHPPTHTHKHTEGMYLTKELANFQTAQQLHHQEVDLVKD
jgi:hypothetical protein